MTSATSSDRLCRVCGLTLAWARTGRPKRYCGPTCRSRAHRLRVRAELAAASAQCIACGTPGVGPEGLCTACLLVLDPLPGLQLAQVLMDGRDVPEPTAADCLCGVCPVHRS